MSASRPVTILYADDDLIVAVKDAGISDKGSELGAMIADAAGREVSNVYRLDREIAGIMIYATYEKSLSVLKDSFASKTAFCEFSAVVNGHIDESGTLRDLIYHDTKRSKSYIVHCMRRGVRDAQLTYEPVVCVGERTLLRIICDSGRAHQIRLQLAVHGMSIVGDRKYGVVSLHSSQSPLALACTRVLFPHPATGEMIDAGYTPSGAEWAVFHEYFRAGGGQA